MARPKKQTVDYFPHVCNHGKTIFILEQKYGNEGYSFWFKLLEMLGSSEGHFIDLNDEVAWEFLQAKTHLSDSLCNDILDLLAKLDAIDKELWQNRIVWCQKFVDGISDAYKNRRVEIPSRPSFYIQKPIQGIVSTDENPETKLNETKLNNTTNPPISPLENEADNFDPVEIESGSGRDIFTAFEKEFGRLLTPFEIETLQSWIGEFSSELILYALKIAILGQNRSFRYIGGILIRWKGEGVKCIQDVEELEKKHQERKRERASPKTQVPSDQDYEIYNPDTALRGAG